MAIQIQIRRDTESNWSSNNPILANAELGFVTDTLQLKIGDGNTNWNTLPYFLNSASATTIEIAEAVSDIIGLSPETLDTLEELADALNNDPDFFNTIGASVTSASAFALSEANDYTDGEITTVTSALASASAQAIVDANDYTDGEVATAIVTASAAAVSYADGLTTTDIDEGTNLYFTNQRAEDATISLIQSASAYSLNESESYADQAIADLVNSAPETLDTLNELAQALGNDENFATTIINTIASASAAAISHADGLTTTDIDEGTNLYFTNQRAEDAVSSTIASASAQAIVDANDYTDGEITTVTSALASASAQSIVDANDYTDGEITTVTSALASASAQAIVDANDYTDGEVATAIVTASAAAVSYADGLTTTDIDEGTNLYYTDTRGLETASTALVHESHVGLSAIFTEGKVIFSITAIDGGEA